MEANDLLTPGRKKARIEIIPLIDVVFFLLATFVLFTLSLDRIGAIQANLPVAPVVTPLEVSTVYLQTSDAGTLYWKLGTNGTPELISASELPARLADYRKRVDMPRVFVRGDNKAKFGAAVAVFDEVRRAGIDQVSIETIPSVTGR